MAIQAIMMMITVMAIGAARETPIIYSNIAKAHVSYDQFKLVYHTNISMPYEMSGRIDILLEAASKACERAGGELCKTNIQQIIATREEEKESFRQIEAYGRFHRNKRSWCDWCGKTLNHMTGVMDAKTAMKYDEKINQLQNESLTQHDLMYNQSRIMETTLRVDKQIMTRLDNKTITLAKELGKIPEEMSKEQERELFTGILSLANSMMIQQRVALDKIKHALMEARTGKIPELIQLDQLNEDIQGIHEALPAEHALPIDFQNEPATNIFTYATTAAAKFGKRVIIEITIPITLRTRFDLFKAVPIPFEVNNHTLIVRPQSTYFLLNEDTSRYIALKQADLETGMKISNKEIIYKPTAIIRLDKDNICEWKAFGAETAKEVLQACKTSQIPTANYVMEINENDLYFVSIAFPLSITETCPNTRLKQETITEDKLIQIKPNCSIKTSQFMIQAKNTYTIDKEQIIQPYLWNETITDEQLMHISQLRPTKINITKPILITEFSQLDRLIRETEEHAKRTDYDLKLENIHYETSKKSIFGILTSITGMFSLASLMTCFVASKMKMVRRLLGILSSNQTVPAAITLTSPTPTIIEMTRTGRCLMFKCLLRT